mgnify:CR=1 FL=1
MRRIQQSRSIPGVSYAADTAVKIYTRSWLLYTYDTADELKQEAMGVTRTCSKTTEVETDGSLYHKEKDTKQEDLEMRLPHAHDQKVHSIST